MITKQQIKDFYQKEGEVSTNTQDMVYSKETSKRRKALVEKMLSKHKVYRFLEIGCAEGMYCNFMLNHAQEVTGMDISKPKLERAINPEKIKYVEGDWDNPPFEPNSFDLVLATECLEHSLDPKLVVENIFKLASLAIFSVPIKEPKLADPMHHHTGHIHAFRPNSFRALFENLGHKITDEYLDEETGFIVLEVIK